MGARLAWSSEDWLVATSLAATLAGLIVGAALGAPGAFGVTTLLVFGLLLIGARRIGSPRLAWLLLFGLVAGVLELWADWVHVVALRSLVYLDHFGFQLLASPSYMPLGWCILIAQFGYIALRLGERWRFWQVVATLVVLGVLLPPWYEELAARARAWYYPAHAAALLHTPVWIFGTYAGCLFFIATAALLFYRKQAWGQAVLAGVFVGGGLLLSSVFWYSLLT